MQALLDDYAVGAALATALVNSGPDVQSRGDQLPDVAALHRLLDEHGVEVTGLDGAGLGGAGLGGAGLGAADLDAVHALRRRLRALLTADDPASGLGDLVAGVAEGPRLHTDPDGRWHWAVRTRPGARPVDALTLVTGVALLAALRALGADRFRTCAAPDCTGMFVDTSRAGRRRYCEPAVCGNRINVAAYRARRRG